MKPCTTDQLCEWKSRKSFIVAAGFVINTDSISRLDNGYTLSLGRGLHFFKRVENKYGLGHSEYRFRKCFECKIGVFFSA